MAVISNPRPSRLTRWLEGRNGRIINFVVIPLLLIAALLLPPISLVQTVADLYTDGITESRAAQLRIRMVHR